MNNLLETLIEITSLQREEIEPALRYFSSMNVAAKTILVKPGDFSQSLWIVDKGILRSYLEVNECKRTGSMHDKELFPRQVTNCIVAEGGLITDYRSFFSRVPATQYIEAVESCSLYRLEYQEYQAIQHSFPLISHSLIEGCLAMAELRIELYNLRNPVNRLKLFEQKYPKLAGRIPISMQASCLDIDRATLSRLRRLH